LVQVDENPNCLNHVELQVHSYFGDSYAVPIIIGTFLLLVVLQWIRLIQRKTALLALDDPIKQMKIDVDQADDDSDQGNVEITA
jgi:hypothetical protein